MPIPHMLRDPGFGPAVVVVELPDYGNRICQGQLVPVRRRGPMETGLLSLILVDRAGLNSGHWYPGHSGHSLM